jgi:peptidoglycan-N-acetylglucosamine deacetylase
MKQAGSQLRITSVLKAFFGTLVAVGSAFAQERNSNPKQVAVTFDDLPVAQSGEAACEEPGLSQHTRQLLRPFQAKQIPLTAFVIAGNCSKLIPHQKAEVLTLWTQAGAEIGNHTYSHRGLNDLPIEEYEQDILRADAELKLLLGLSRIRYFRSPMLQVGPTPEIKRRLESFLKANSYQQSPVTLDNSDWIYAYVYSRALARNERELAERARNSYVDYMESVVKFFERRSVDVVGREFPQILLLHSNKLNAAAAPDLISMLEKRGYEFVSLEKALTDAAYGQPNEYAGRGGFSWIHRWSMTKGMKNKGEPEPPDWIMQEFERTQ